MSRGRVRRPDSYRKARLVTTIPRLFLTALVPLALASAPATASPTPASSAVDSPSVAYKNIDKECSSYVMDGQEQKQCQADFTVVVTDIKKNFKIVVTARDPRHDTTSTIGRFTSAGASAKKRFRDVVVSYGPTDDQIRMRFRVIVRNAAGEKVFASKPRTF